MTHHEEHTAQVRDEPDPAQWAAVEMGTVGAVRLEELPQVVRERVEAMRKRCAVLDRERGGWQWEDTVFADEPHGRLWRIGIWCEDNGPWELEVSHLVYRERHI